jgi:myo-inositol-1(or 4)-monophosphatase
MSAFINIATKAAYAAASTIQQGSRNLSNLNITKKGHNDFVTNLDKDAEAAIIKIIKKAFPTHSILAEESGYTGGGDNINSSKDNNGQNAEYTWIIDPLDGTTNFIHGHPQYSISIALKHHDKITDSVIFDPNRNELYHAGLGKGAFLNDKRIRVTNVNYLEDALIATGFPTYDMSKIDQYLAIFKDMLVHTVGQRRCGSAALDLAFVAAGRVDGFWEFNLKPWDFAAGFLLVKEAGGLVTDLANTQDFWDNGNIVAANPKLIAQMLKIIQAHV